jgi:hypothetical protein
MKTTDLRGARKSIWRSVCGQVAFALAAVPSIVWAQEYSATLSAKIGETLDVFPVYWVGNCQSRLVKFEGIDVLEGPSGVTLALREQKVFARRQNCPNQIPGAVVTLTVQTAAAKFSGPVAFRVRYFTEDGRTQSSHRIKLDVY